MWKAIDANGDVLDILSQPRRNAKAARRLLGWLVATYSNPRVVITDKLRSYTKPIKAITPGADHRAHKGPNNRSEGSHLSTQMRKKDHGPIQVNKPSATIPCRPRSDQHNLQNPPISPSRSVLPPREN
ncbi:hypothetical protein AVO44_12200 [Ruegeria profundi]|uniref:DDE domain-containing protein n=1 Tax=Ruegeria profundi TaxID=1685378 RepID=A0A0X3TRV9_9RHOB|nr:hypothetical protein AVO44_12200 [Ruegeria profundi]